jgi:MFS family permease
MLVGALFWGLSADIIGRKHAFNYSLLISSIFTIVAGASPNWIVLGFFISMSAFGAGGNLVLDTAVFLEYLPSKHQWLLTLMAAWWGVGQLVAGLFAWAFLPNFSCAGPESETGMPCNWNNNAGWRYVWFTSGALVFTMSIARVTVIRLRETPKYLVGEGRDEEVVETLQFIAKKYNRQCSLTLESMQACGVTDLGDRRGSVSAHSKRKFSFGEVGTHLKGLFATRKMGLSTSLIWFSWVSDSFCPEMGSRHKAALTDMGRSSSSVLHTLSTTYSFPSTSVPVAPSSVGSLTVRYGAITPSPT